MGLRRALVLAGLLAACAGSPDPAAPLQRFEFEHAQMGTLFRVVVHAESAGAASEGARAAFERLDELDARLSDYDPDSELSRLSRASDLAVPTDWIAISPDLARVLARAAEISSASGGAFDVTCGRATRLWRRAIRERELPEQSLLEEARQSTDWRAIELAPGKDRVRLHLASMRIDLGGIAKGYALDQMLEVLARHGLRSALVDGGGDVAVGDPPPGASAWRVAVDPPTSAGPQEGFSIDLVHAALATSGDVYRSLQISGRRYSHIVDPSTGLGLSTPAGASVVARDGMTADALATAATVLGPARAAQLWEQFPECGGRVVAGAADGGSEFLVHESAFFRALRAR